ncbi:MAG: hypothetical protein HYW47_00890 [Deltaproteobacteria bacterium]|nr:hypothetical protein [Deltaproteobacteria bacterium]
MKSLSRSMVLVGVLGVFLMGCGQTSTPGLEQTNQAITETGNTSDQEQQRTTTLMHQQEESLLLLYQ